MPSENETLTEGVTGRQAEAAASSGRVATQISRGAAEAVEIPLRAHVAEDAIRKWKITS